MYCKKCGSELKGTEAYCSVCGNPVHTAGVKAGAADSGQQAAVVAGNPGADAQAYRSFEYCRTTVTTDLAQAACDCYESLGFELTGQQTSAASGQAVLSFRRDRKVRGKAQLAKIQRGMDDTLASIAALEAEKTKKAAKQAVTFGTLSALVLGVGMCCTMVWEGLMALGIVVGLVGIAGCVFAWLRYGKVCKEEAARLNPQIANAYDRLATLSEEAQAVLRAGK